MAGYVPRTGAAKKCGILSKRIIELTGAIDRVESEARLERAADKVREAQLGVLKCWEYECAPASENDARYRAVQANIQDRKERWEQATVAQIINHYTSGKGRAESPQSLALHEPPIH
jgi:hypothetical protein